MFLRKMSLVLLFGTYVLSCGGTREKTVSSSQRRIKNMLAVSEVNMNNRLVSETEYKRRKLPVLIKTWKQKGSLAFLYKSGHSGQGEESARILLWGLKNAVETESDNEENIKKALLSMDDYLIPVLQKSLKNKELAESASMTAVSLGEKSPVLIPQLKDLVLDKSFSCSARLAAVVALGEIAPDNDEVAEVLKKVAAENNGDLSIMALSIVNSSETKDEKTVNIMISKLKNEVGVNRAAVAHLLSDNKKFAPIIRPALRAVLYDFHDYVRLYVRDSLRKLKYR